MECGSALLYDRASARKPSPASNVEVPDIQGVVLDELFARLDLLAHELGEHLFSLDSIGEVDPQKLAFRRVHRGVEKLLGIHLAQALETLDLQTAAADLFDAGKDFGNGEERLDRRLLALAFDQFEERL